MKRKDDFVKQNVGGENLLVPIGAQVMDLNGIIVLNETASFIWDLLEKDRTEEELIKALTEEYEIDPQSAKEDVNKFVSEITKLKLIQ